MSVQPLIPNPNFTDLEVATDAVMLARQVVGMLIQAGVKDIVVCPGSRNAPLLYAVAGAETAGRIRVHVKLDERSAGFYALGLCRSSQLSRLQDFNREVGSEQSGKRFTLNRTEVRAANGMRPVAIMVTSGTAAGELHPAVLEAHQVGAPLIVITADRPKYMVGTGANQTTNQEAIYGWAVQGCLQVEAVGAKPNSALKGGEEDGMNTGEYLWGDALAKQHRKSGGFKVSPELARGERMSLDCAGVSRPDLRSRFHKQVGTAVSRSKHPSATQPTIPVITPTNTLAPDSELVSALTVALTVAIGGKEEWSPNHTKNFLEYESWHANRICASGPLHLNLRWAPPLTPSDSWEWPADQIPVFNPAQPLICPSCRQPEPPRKASEQLESVEGAEEAGGSVLGKIAHFRPVYPVQTVHSSSPALHPSNPLGQPNEGTGGKYDHQENRDRFKEKGAPRFLPKAVKTTDQKCCCAWDQYFLSAAQESQIVTEEYRDPALPPLSLTARTVLIAADQARPDVVSVLSRFGLPVLVEPTAPVPIDAQVISHSSLLLSRFEDQIDQIIVTGHPTLSRPITGLLSRTDLPIYVVNPGLPRFDLSGTSHQIGVCALQKMLSATPRMVQAELRRWREEWEQQDFRVDLRFEHYCVKQAFDLDQQGIIDPYVFARMLNQYHQLPGAPAVFLGASNTIRAFDRAISYSGGTFGWGTIDEDPVASTDKNRDGGGATDNRGAQTLMNHAYYFANRGLAGIDGNISTALGMAIGSGQPFRMVCGDLTFLHDLTGLLQGDLEPESLAPNSTTGTGIPGRPCANLDVFVLNDHGGQIFSSLEHGRPQYAPVFQRYFRTPQCFQVAKIAAGLGWEYRQIQSLGQLHRVFQRQPLGLRIYELNTDVPNYRQVRETFFNSL